MQIKILHLYYDLLNLYGESGNVRILEKRLIDNGFDVAIDRMTITDNVELNDYDFVYLGSGTESKLYRCAEHFVTLANQLDMFLNGGKILLATGNSCEMLGKCITGGNGEKIPCAGLFDFETEHNFSVRKTGDVICSCPFIDEKIVGFINNCSTVSGNAEPIFTFELGGNGAMADGVRRGNVFGTHITGPIMVKNPYFLEYIMAIICEHFGVERTRADEESFQYQSYRITLSELMRDR